MPWDENGVYFEEEYAAPLDIVARGRARRAGGGATARTLGLTPGQVAPAQTIITLPPPELVLFPGGQMIYGEGRATVANSATAVLATIQLPEATVAVINSLIIGGVNVVTGLVATWAVRENEAPIPGLTRSLPPQNAAAAFVGWGPDEILARIGAGSRIDLLVSVTAGGPVDVTGQLSGWQYPATTRDRYAASWEG